MKKIILVLGVAAALVVHGRDYKTISFMACQNYVGVLKKLATVVEDGMITIDSEASTATITSYGVTRSFKIVSSSNHTYQLNNGNQLIVSERSKQIRYDVKGDKSDQHYNYSYLYNIK